MSSMRFGRALFIVCQTMALHAAATNAALTADQRHIPPFMTQNWLPTALIFGLPGFNTRMLPLDQPVEMAIQVTTANIFVHSAKSNEAIFLDGEVSAIMFSAHWRIRDDWQIGFTLPYIYHSQGVLDDIITDWHDFFGLPQDGRQDSTNEQFRYAYSNKNSDSFDFRDESGATGDIRLTLSTAPFALYQNVLAHIEVKLPSGDPDRFTGSGAWDFSTGLGWQDDSHSLIGKISLYSALGFTYLGETKITALNDHRRSVLTARGGIHWHTLDWVTLSAQLDSHTKIYDSNIKPIGSNSLQLTFGAHLLLKDGVRLSLSVGEDLNVRVTPDFVINAAVAYRF